APSYRTLLLGMKSEREYRFRIIANAGECTSDDYSITTGALPDEVVRFSSEVFDPGAVADGFIISTPGIVRGGPMYIIDRDGDVVWYADAPGSSSRARLDWDAQHMWVTGLNRPQRESEMRRVSMDGL